MRSTTGTVVLFSVALAFVLVSTAPGTVAAVSPRSLTDETGSLSSAVQIRLVSPAMDYAILAPWASIQVSITGSGFDGAQYSFDGGMAETAWGYFMDPSTYYAFLANTAWTDGMHLLTVDALSGSTVVASRTFVTFTDGSVTSPLDTMSVNVILVGYDEMPADLQWRLYSYWGTQAQMTNDPSSIQDFQMRFDFNVQSADPSYAVALLDAARTAATYRTDLQARLNLPALIQQRDTGTPMDIFDSLVGYELPSSWLEQYVQAEPPVPGIPASDYTFYLVNLGGLDDPAAGVDHWFVRPIADTDTGQVQDWWRLEWDNALNTPMGYPLNMFGGPDHRVFVDPTAYEWYLDWTNVWWYLSDERAPYGYEYEEIATADRAQYLADYVNYLIEGLTIELPWAPPQESKILIRNYVLDGSSTVDAPDLSWVVHDQPLLDYLSGFLPMKTWDIQTTIEPLSAMPSLSDAVNGYTTWHNDHGYIDGDSMWTYLYDHKTDFVTPEPDTFEILTVNFVFDDRSMVSGGLEYTGLGGNGITAIFLQTHRLFTQDGRPQKGFTDTIAHETGHNLGYGHQFGWYYYADFIDGGMGYFREEMTYGTFYEDALYRVYIREKQLELVDLLDHTAPIDLWAQFKAFYQDYQDLRFLAAYNDLVAIEAYVSDATPPITSITSAMNGDGIAVTSGGSTVSSAMEFSFTSTKSETVTGFECTLDGMTAPCSSPVVYTGLAPGPHTFQVHAYDGLGRYSTPIPEFSWTVLTPAEATQRLAAYVAWLPLSSGVRNSLLDPLHVAYDALVSGRPGGAAKACRQLDAFIAQVGLYEAKGRIWWDEAAKMQLDAWEIEVALSCP